MQHLWVRAESRADEARVGLTPEGAERLIAAGLGVTVEQSPQRAIPIGRYRDAGCRIAPEGSWPQAPRDSVIFGLKELPDGASPLIHRHVMFGHALKGQPGGQRLLRRFAAGGGRLYDLEYLTDADGRRIAAFGYWAGYAGAAVSLLAWAAQQQGAPAAPLEPFEDRQALLDRTRQALAGTGRPPPSVLIVGALGRVGTGAADLCAAADLQATLWDKAETAGGAPFPEILQHEVFLNCILALPGAPVFVPPDALTAERRLRVIGDIACDPDSDFSPVRVYDSVTDWQAPARRVHADPPLDVVAIDNLPALLALESSQDFAAQLEPALALLRQEDGLATGPWALAAKSYDRVMAPAAADAPNASGQPSAPEGRIHWCGTGLSSLPGLRALIDAGDPVTVWNRSVDKAVGALGDRTDDIRAFDPGPLKAALSPGDVVVSMLPGDWHKPLAEICLEQGAQFVSSSYISPQMAALDGQARAAGLSLVNEVGLDPGIDHLMAHRLVADWRAAPSFDPDADLAFVSYCGGLPAWPNPFRYKFSWSPLGVLKALTSPSRSIRDSAVWDVEKPWEAVGRYTAPLPVPETFEVYPNRDSLPYLAEYGFDPGWPVRQFVRGTLRLDGWAEAWAPVFREIEEAGGDEAALGALAEQLWQDHAYAPGEPDRVVLCVGLRAGPRDAPIHDRTWILDATGTADGSAMARLVSGTVALAVAALRAGRIGPGVQAAPSDPDLVAEWLEAIAGIARTCAVVDQTP